MFDEYLERRAADRGELFQAFTHVRDYLAYVDGRPREQGIATFLASRGIHLELGRPDDRPGTETIRGLGNRKNAIFHEAIESGGVGLFETSIALIRRMQERGIKVGLATSSQNCGAVLRRSGIAELFGTVVDGVVSAELRLRGKPEPDIFLQAARNLDVPANRAVVVEDAVSGVQAGAKGGFGLVIGVARENNEAELKVSGADIVVADLGQTSVELIDEWVLGKRQQQAGDIGDHRA
jgi:HAD superfamily hydrolase (TIGR01509 family)